MFDVVPHKKALKREGRIRNYKADPVAIRFSPTERATVSFEDGSSGKASCLGCHDAPCIEFGADELSLGGELENFPGDPSQNVCPTNAINWNDAATVPVIDTKRCIGCGLCTSRCPYGAINLTVDRLAVIERDDPDRITTSALAVAAPHLRPPREGALGSVETHFAKNLPSIVAGLSDTQTTQLTRNILVTCGVSANMRRKGDTNIRFDGLIRFMSGKIGVIELETSDAVLESPRALLEDIAVLHNRWNVPLVDIVPISIIGTFPNLRVEYYQVIKDIESVLDIRCRTLTLGALCMLMWHFGTLPEMEESNLFMTGAADTEIYSSLVKLIPDLPPEEPHLGAYKPAK